MLWGGAATLHISPTRRIINRHLREMAPRAKNKSRWPPHPHKSHSQSFILLQSISQKLINGRWTCQHKAVHLSISWRITQDPVPPGSVTYRNILRHIFHLHQDASRCTAAWLRWCAGSAWWRCITLRVVLIPQAAAWGGWCVVPATHAGWAFIGRRIRRRAGILLQSLELQQRALQAEAKHANEV